MKTCFVDAATRSIADVCRYHPDAVTFDGYMITRINVPEEHRGKRIGSKLLREICEAADVENATLWLEIAPSGALNYDELRAWYKRYGFRGCGLYRREPRLSWLFSAQARPTGALGLYTLRVDCIVAATNVNDAELAAFAMGQERGYELHDLMLRGHGPGVKFKSDPNMVFKVS